MIYSEKTSVRAFNILAQEAFCHLGKVNEALEIIWARRPTNANGYVLLSDVKMADAIHELVLSFSAASTLLFDSSAKRTSENSSIYQMRMDRIKRFNEMFVGIDTTIYSDRAIRHRHVHSDEYVSKFICQNPEALLIQDIAVSNRDVFQSEFPIIYLRVLDYSGDKLLHLGLECDVARLYETNLALNHRMNA